MFCPKCGAANDDNAYKCVKCETLLHPESPQVPVVKVANYLVWSIVVTILCCLPCGIVAIIYSTQVNTKANSGDLNGAMESSKKAKMWIWISVVLGIIFTVIWMALQILALTVAGNK